MHYDYLKSAAFDAIDMEDRVFELDDALKVEGEASLMTLLRTEVTSFFSKFQSEQLAQRVAIGSGDDEKEGIKEYKLFGKYFFPIVQRDVREATNDVLFRAPKAQVYQDAFDTEGGLPLLVSYIVLTMPLVFDLLKHATLKARFHPGDMDELRLRAGVLSACAAKVVAHASRADSGYLAHERGGKIQTAYIPLLMSMQ